MRKAAGQSAQLDQHVSVQNGGVGVIVSVPAGDEAAMHTAPFHFHGDADA